MSLAVRREAARQLGLLDVSASVSACTAAACAITSRPCMLSMPSRPAHSKFKLMIVSQQRSRCSVEAYRLETGLLMRNSPVNLVLLPKSYRESPALAYFYGRPSALQQYALQ